MTGQDLDLGPVNGHIIEIILISIVRRAIEIIRDERPRREVIEKMGPTGAMDDFVTSADIKAQDMWKSALRKCFPGFGIVCEENGVVIKSTRTDGALFTVDPLDGTENYKSGNLQGVSTMVALAVGKEVPAAYVGDVATGDIFGYGPASKRVRHYTGLNSFSRIKAPLPDSRPLSESRLYMRRPVHMYSGVVREIAGQCKYYEHTSSSIGIWMTRLLRGEFRIGALWSGTVEKPWDLFPVYGILRKFGHVFLRSTADGTALERFDLTLPAEDRTRGYDIVHLHKNDLWLVSHLMRT